MDGELETIECENGAARRSMQRLVLPSLVLIHGDCRAVAHEMEGVDCVITDPPYPNGQGHFEESIAAAEEFIRAFRCDHWFIFWDEMSEPPCPLPLVAKHVWHRTNTNRPDNYEPIYEFHADGKKRASRVLPYPVVFPGLTGCVEATGHPTQKSLKLMKKLVQMSKAKSVADPFSGSGSTAEACANLGVRFIGAEIDEKHFRDACDRAKRELSQDDFFRQNA